MPKKSPKQAPRKVLSPEEERDLAPILQTAEKMTQAGFVPPPVPSNQSFDLAADMQAQQQAFGNQMSLDQMQNQAIQTAGLDPMTKNPMPEIPAEEEQEEEKEEEKTEEKNAWLDDPEPPSDPIQRIHWTAKRLFELDPKAPNANTLYNWKQTHGGVYVLNITDHVFLYRYLKLAEWRVIKAKPEWENLDTDKRNLHLVVRCLLWPKLDPVAEASLPAGTIDMLAEQIQMQSMFLNPQVVAGMTLKL